MTKPEGILIDFGQGHDSKYGDNTIDATPENKVSIMDRGFSSQGGLKELLAQKIVILS